MKFYIIIPVHNEEETIGQTLESLVHQTYKPDKVMVVNDNSTDDTEKIIRTFVEKYDWIETLYVDSNINHVPGAKVIEAFYKGLAALDEEYDIICKFDADIIFPENYLQSVAQLFKSDPKIGIAGGLPFVNVNGNWIFENIASKEHVRGPIKSYRKSCFKEIGGLKKSAGWDSVDVLLAKYYGWKVATDKTLHVQHLRPTGTGYHKDTQYLRGEALYKMRMGLVLTIIASLKSAFKKKQLADFTNALKGYKKAKQEGAEYLVDEVQGKFIRKLHWQNIKKRFKMN